MGFKYYAWVQYSIMESHSTPELRICYKVPIFQPKIVRVIISMVSIHRTRIPTQLEYIAIKQSPLFLFFLSLYKIKNFEENI